MRSTILLGTLAILTLSFSTGWSAKFLTSRNLPVSTGDDLDCQLSSEVVQEIASHSEAVQLIADLVLRGEERHKTYELLEDFVDRFGARFSGSEALENSIDHLVDRLTQEDLENVHTEPVDVQHWVREDEKAWMVSPYHKRMSILALGRSVSTPEEGLNAEVLVVRSFDELTSKESQVSGKIVVYAYNFSSYAAGYHYRSQGAAKASALGAVAALIRSAADFSLDTPHTGDQRYGNASAIPVASITLEDALLFDRLDKKGVRIVVHLKIKAETMNQTVSRNTVAELAGTKYPEQLVIIGGHVDSWDVGQGAVDDAGGVFVSWRALSLLKRLGLRPKRTLRTVLWTGEEVGLMGAKQYTTQHSDEEDNISIALESDYGTFAPLGLFMQHQSQEALCLARQVLTLFHDINNATLLVRAAEGPDLIFWHKRGVPTAGLVTENHRYFQYHHTNADTVAVLDPDDLDLCTAFWAGVAYVFANLEHLLPRT